MTSFLVGSIAGAAALYGIALLLSATPETQTSGSHVDYWADTPAT